MKASKKSNQSKAHRTSWKSLVESTNAILQNLTDALRSETSVPDFGSHLSQENADVCINSILRHRVINKFFKPDTDGATVRRRNCYETYIAYDNSLSDVRVDLWDSSSLAYHQRKVRQTLHEWLGRYDFSVITDDLDFTPGETIVSAQGDVSVLAKLDDVKHWSCIDVCFDVACEITYNNRSLRMIAMQHLNGVSISEYRALYISSPANLSHRKRCEWVWTNLMTEVITVFTADKAGSVFKNIDTDRFIGLGTFWAMIRQRQIAHGLRVVLKYVGNDLGQRNFVFRGYRHLVDDAQAVHQIMISDKSYATVDFKNGSDSTVYQPVETLTTPNLMQAIDQCRPTHVAFPHTVHQLNKVSSMGVGFTFELMTLMLLACARQFDKTARVYGDDVIIKNDAVQPFLELVKSIGYQINDTKTFINSRFRESCGSFYHDDHGYITCYDFTWCKTFQDVIVTHNKLLDIISNNPTSALVVHFQQALDAIRSLDIPTLCKGPIPGNTGDFKSNFDLYLYYPEKSVVRLHRKHNFELYDRWSKKLQHVFEDLHIDSPYVVVEIPVFVNHRSCKVTSRLVKERVRLLHKRQSFRTLREKGRWIHLPAIVTLSDTKDSHGFNQDAGRLTMCRSFRPHMHRAPRTKP